MDPVLEVQFAIFDEKQVFSLVYQLNSGAFYGSDIYGLIKIAFEPELQLNMLLCQLSYHIMWANIVD